MLQFLSHAHSGLRYLILALLIYVILSGLWALITKQIYTKLDKLSALVLLALVHTQLILGVVLYFLSPKVVFSELTMKISAIRFLTVEHPLMMIVAIVLITIGYSKAKKSQVSEKHKTIVIYYGIALALIIAAIPWRLLA